jgi:ribonuclease Z
MDLIFLGTSAGVPTRSRNVSGTALIESTGKGWYLVECGEATQHQMLRTPLSLRELRGCFITHVHGDHCFGLPGLLASAGMSGRVEPLDIVLPVALHPWLRLSLTVSKTWLPFELRLHASETVVAWQHGNVKVETVALSHRVPCHGYVFTEADPHPRLDVQRLASKGYRAALCGASWRVDAMLNTADEYSARSNFCGPHALLNALSFAAITTTLICWRKRRSELMYWCMRRPLHKP